MLFFWFRQEKLTVYCATLSSEALISIMTIAIELKLGSFVHNTTSILQSQRNSSTVVPLLSTEATKYLNSIEAICSPHLHFHSFLLWLYPPQFSHAVPYSIPYLKYKSLGFNLLFGVSHSHWNRGYGFFPLAGNFSCRFYTLPLGNSLRIFVNRSKSPQNVGQYSPYIGIIALKMSAEDRIQGDSKNFIEWWWGRIGGRRSINTPKHFCHVILFYTKQEMRHNDDEKSQISSQT